MKSTTTKAAARAAKPRGIIRTEAELRASYAAAVADGTVARSQRHQASETIGDMHRRIARLMEVTAELSNHGPFDNPDVIVLEVLRIADCLRADADEASMLLRDLLGVPAEEVL